MKNIKNMSIVVIVIMLCGAWSANAQYSNEETGIFGSWDIIDNNRLGMES